MTEADWLVCDDPLRMLEWLTADRGPSGYYVRHDGPISARKLRLFTCACCRQVWDQLTDPRSRRAVEVAELRADGLHAPEEWGGAHNAAVDARVAVSLVTDARHAARMAELAVMTTPGVEEVLREHTLIAADQAETRRVQAALLRDVCGDLWRPTAVDPAWLAWNDGTVRRLAEACYGAEVECDTCRGSGSRQVHRRSIEAAVCGDCHGSGKVHASFAADQLPVLADSLEEAGCTDAEILNHLRGTEQCWCLSGIGPGGQQRLNYPCDRCRETGRIPLRGPHVRGCWAVDLLLGKE